MKSLFTFLIGITGAALCFSFAERASEKTPPLSFTIDTLAANLYVPWDLTFIPDKTMLFTERPGRVRLYRNNHLVEKPILILDDVEVKGKMGLLGLCLHPGFAVNHFVYLAYNYRQGDRTFLRIARYRYGRDTLTDPKLIIENIPGVFNHTGSRLKFGPDKKLYITTGDADVPQQSQDLKALNGKILRLNDDGGIPGDNPFVGSDTARHEIWTYGHRNPQGIAFQPGTGYLFESEHGPTGGDEINLIKKGHNYGWPLIHHKDTRPGMETPLLAFTPSIGPSEALFYSGRAFPSLKGNLLVACLRGEAILRLQLAQQKIVSSEFLLKNKFGRIRALVEGPDGYLYISTSQIDPPESNEAPGTNGVDLILRLRPAASLKDAIQANAIAAPAAATASPHDRRPATLYSQLCASCHGADLKGTTPAQNLVDSTWLHGSARPDLIRSIRSGIVAKGMPSWEGVLTDKEIGEMAEFILQHKKGKS